MHNYNTIVINDFEVTYRHRDTYDRIKIGDIKHGGYELDLPNALDDCHGKEFFQLLEILDRSNGNPELAEVKMVSRFG